VLAEFARSLQAELDFRIEGRATIEMAAAVGPDSPVRIPAIYNELCTRRLLVEERFEGVTVGQLDRRDPATFDRSTLANGLLRCALEQIVRLGFFHADPHPGNVFVFDDGTLGLIDFGAVGRLDPIQQAAVVDMLAAIVQRDVGLLRDGLERVTDVTGDVSDSRLERALARLIADNLRVTGDVDPKVLQDLVPMLAEFDIRLPGDLILLSRALVTLDGTLRVIAPDMSTMSTAIGLVAKTQEPAVDPSDMVRGELLSALPRLRHLPERIDRLMTLAARGDLRIRHIADEDGTRLVRTLVNRAVLSAVGIAFLLASAVLLAAPDGGPTVSSGTGLFELFGYAGLFIGSVLLLRVVAVVARDGTM
jgi:ubiquinone biosynthesis protein